MAILPIGMGKLDCQWKMIKNDEWQTTSKKLQLDK